MRRLIPFFILLLLIVSFIFYGEGVVQKVVIRVDPASEHDLAEKETNSGQTIPTIIQQFIRDIKLRSHYLVLEATQAIFEPQLLAISGNYYTNKNNYQNEVNIALNDIFPSFDILKIMRSLSNMPWVEDSRLSLSIYPLEFSVSIIEAEPWIVAVTGETSWLISETTNILQPLESLDQERTILHAADLLRVYSINSDVIDPSKKSVLSAVRLVELAGGLPFEISYVEIQLDHSIHYYPLDNQNPVVRIKPLYFEQTKFLLANLNNILEDMAGRSEKPKMIDLRFNDQAVVRLAESSATEIRKLEALQ